MNTPKVIVNLQFDEVKFTDFLKLFESLPDNLKPNRWGWGEVGKTTPITDFRRFADDMLQEKLGPYMRGPRGVEYALEHGGISTQGKKYLAECTCWVAVRPEVVQEFVLHMSQAIPFFGFACSWEEYEQRNRIIQKMDIGKVLAWAGRDSQKYLPGLYWITVISEQMAKLHELSVDRIVQIADEYIHIPNGVHFFRFYHHPEDWLATEKLQTLLITLPNVFNIQSVRKLAEKARNDAELNEILTEWR